MDKKQQRFILEHIDDIEVQTSQAANEEGAFQLLMSITVSRYLRALDAFRVIIKETKLNGNHQVTDISTLAVLDALSFDVDNLE